MKKEPFWVLEKTVLKIHDLQIAEHGGSEGIRDAGLLQSAIHHPINLYSYEQSSIPELAAAYAERIIKNHPFVDGNKRTAYVVMSLFLTLNHFKLDSAQEEKIMKFVELASGGINLKDFITWLENTVIKIKNA